MRGACEPGRAHNDQPPVAEPAQSGARPPSPDHPSRDHPNPRQPSVNPPNGGAMKHHLSWRPVMLILGTAVALTAAACGSSSTPSAPSASASSVPTLKVALIEPSLRNDLAFSQSMYAAASSLAGPLHFTLSVSDNLFNTTDAANAMRQYASEGYNLVIAHGSQYGGTVQELAPQFPKTSFAWGTAGVTYGLKNVFAYQANSQ